MSDPVYGDQFAALRQENARLRERLDATAQAHERDVVRLARALGWTHEPPASVDEVVERAAALHAENARLTAERDALARGEDMPSLDAIRAHGGVWVVTDGSTATTLSLRVDATTVYAVDACGCDLRYDAERFAELHAGCRWWRVRSDGTLAAGLTGDDGAR